jgi:D-amino peptidase
LDVFISADVEGVAGIASWDQIIPGREDYPIGRALMTGEVNAAIEGALAAGAGRIVVNDAHALMTNVLPESLNPAARLVSGRFKPMYMLQGLDDSFDAVFFVGYHGSIGEPEAILSHTYNPDAIWEAKVDGRVAGELGINALVCEYFGVPIRLVTGDQAIALEAREVVPSVHVAEVKLSFGRYSAESMHPSEARATIRREAEACLGALADIKPSRHSHTIGLTFLIADMAATAEWIKGVERTGPRTIVFTAPDGLEAYQIFHAILMLTRNLAD